MFLRPPILVGETERVPELVNRDGLDASSAFARPLGTGDANVLRAFVVTTNEVQAALVIQVFRRGAKIVELHRVTYPDAIRIGSHLGTRPVVFVDIDADVFVEIVAGAPTDQVNV